MKTKITISLLLAFLPLFILLGDGLMNDTIPKDNSYGVIYGNTVLPDGTPSPRLTARLDAGLELYNKDTIQTIIVSGGLGKEGFEEAEVMKEYLEKKGVINKNIIVDNQGYTSRQTSENTFQIISEREENPEDISVIGISQWFHISRAKLSLQQVGFETVFGHAPKYFEWRDLYSILREVPAYIKYLLHL